MRAYCIAFGCLNSYRDRNLTFFSLPKDIERRRKWLELIDREDLLQREDLKKSSHLICSAHFEDSSFKIIKHLKNNALPSKLLPNQPKESIPSCSQSTVARKKNKGKGIILSNNTDNVSVGTQTESLRSTKDQTQTSKLLTEEKPRKRKLTNEVRKCKSKRQKLEQEIIKIRKELKTTNEPITCNSSDDEIGRRLQKLIEWQNRIKNKYKGNRYDAEYKVFALNLHYSSPQAYRCLQKVLKLPCRRTLNRIKINIPPKFDNRLLDSLALKIMSLPDVAKNCTICVDEMILKRNLYYNIKTDEIIGFHNVNGNISPEIASNAFVIMLQGIYFKWKQPLAYALLATAKHYGEIDMWLNEVITKLSTIGIKVRAIISNQGSNFDTFAKEIKKVTVEKPYFIYDDNIIYYIFDVPHLINCIRDNLLTNDFIYDGKKISWDYIEQLYSDQKERNLRLIPKVTDAHMQPYNFQRISVKLAVQTLSRSVSAALHSYIDLGKISEEARATAEFLEFINDLFDILNSNKIKCCSNIQTAYILNKDQENVLTKAMEIFPSVKAINRKTGKMNIGHIKSFVNFQISITSIIMLFEDLKLDGFKCLLTRRLNQDNLENFFGAIRQQRGSSNEPTPIQFQRAFSKLLLCNCKMDLGDILLKAEDITKVQLFGTNSSPQTDSICLGGETDYRIDLPDENALIYVSGYLFFKCVNEHKCPDIIKLLETVPELGETNLFTRYKAFNKKSEFYGSLKMPPNEFIQYVQNLETAFTQNFEKLIRNNPGGELLKLFKTIPQQTPCTCFPVDYLLKLFARFCIFSTIKFNNRQFKDGTKGIKKCVTVRHL